MNYKQLQRPDTYYQDLNGYSLRYVQNAFQAPVKHGFAWDAWESTEHKHAPEEALPDAFVPVWFWTSYQGITPMGHVLIWDPERQKLFGPPMHGGGIEFYDLQQVTNQFTKYVGWSEDINGLRVLEPVND